MGMDLAILTERVGRILKFGKAGAGVLLKFRSEYLYVVPICTLLFCPVTPFFSSYDICAVETALFEFSEDDEVGWGLFGMLSGIYVFILHRSVLLLLHLTLLTIYVYNNRNVSRMTQKGCVFELKNS